MTFEITLLQLAAALGVLVYLAIAFGVFQVLKFRYDSLTRCAVYGLFWPIGLLGEIYEGIKEDVLKW